MEQYKVTGMTCAACQARVEKAVSQVEGVTNCAVSLLTNSMSVEGTASSKDIIKAVVNAGYDASLKGAQTQETQNNDEDDLKDTQTPLLMKRLKISLLFLVVLMYFSMGINMFNFYNPFPNNPIAIGLTQMILALIIMVINKQFFISGFKSLLHKAPNMDTLVALGSFTSFIYSLCLLYYASFLLVDGNHHLAMHQVHEFYFESAAMILTLITVGKMLEARSKGKTTDAIKSLMKLSAKTAIKLVDGKEVEVKIEDLKIDDLFVVKPGANIPVDGIIIQGNSAIDESSLTGESIPVDKNIGDDVYSATINQSGHLVCKATHVGKDTTLSKIIQMVSDAAASKAPIAKIADKVSGIFVPTVISIAIITIIIWLLLGKSIGYALTKGITVLVISCPCALGLATPVAIMVGNGVGAKNGILFKTAVSLEKTGKTDIVVFDKTGTITNGTPEVTDVISLNDDLLKYAYSLEVKSEHPLAKAIINYGKKNNIELVEVNDFNALVGNGLKGMIDNHEIIGGSYQFISSICAMSDEIKNKNDLLASLGKTPLYFACDKQLLGIIAVADTIKKESKEAISQLQNMGIKTIMLTGDNQKTATAIGKIAGVQEVISDVKPDGKERVIAKLKSQGMVMMVGDGINDAPALTRADIGVGIGKGSDIAIEAGEIVLMKSNLLDVPAAIRLSKYTLKNIKENLFWAFIYNIIGIPLAAGLYSSFGWSLSPMFGAAAMSLSSFCVCSNALRLNLKDIYNSSHDKPKKQKSKKGEPQEMTKTMSIEGMMCPHCEATVKKALEAIEGVASAEVSHVDNQAIVTLTAEVSNEVLKEAVEAKDYKVLSIQ